MCDVTLCPVARFVPIGRFGVNPVCGRCVLVRVSSQHVVSRDSRCRETSFGESCVDVSKVSVYGGSLWQR